MRTADTRYTCTIHMYLYALIVLSPKVDNAVKKEEKKKLQSATCKQMACTVSHMFSWKKARTLHNIDVGIDGS